jgi:hypothetical protein
MKPGEEHPLEHENLTLLLPVGVPWQAGFTNGKENSLGWDEFFPFVREDSLSFLE